MEAANSSVEASLNVMTHAQKPDFVFRRNGRVHLNRQERQFSRLLAVEVCASAVVMLDIPCSEVVWRVLATHCIRQFPLHFPSRASPCAITFRLESNISKQLPDYTALHGRRPQTFVFLPYCQELTQEHYFVSQVASQTVPRDGNRYSGLPWVGSTYLSSMCRR